jgi:glucose-6-phosphate 1-epimerase
VWNPWAELAATMADMEPEGWRTMTCVETANVGESAVTLAPGETHTMRAVISVQALG